MLNFPCINCEKAVYLDENRQPMSKYWLANPDDLQEIMAVFCGPQCATEYKNKNESD